MSSSRPLPTPRRWPSAAVALRVAVGVAAVYSTLPAVAHVAVEPASVTAGTTARLALRIAHGCDGSPTRTVIVTLPPGTVAARPMPKPGWSITLTRSPLPQPVSLHGREIADDVSEIRWSAATRDAWLDDAHFDEFVLLARPPATPGTVWLRVTQLCEQGRLDWQEVPADATAARALARPAVPLRVVPPAAADGAAHRH